MKRPWMPLYVADYLADTAHLSALESGAYLHLIMHYWLKGGLPKDHRQLAKIARMSPKQFNQALPIIAPFFASDWTHKRIDQELEKANNLSKVRRAAVAQRKDRSSTNEVTIVDQLHTQSQSQLQTQIKDKEDNSPVTPSRGTKAKAIASDWEPSEQDIAFAEAAKVDWRAEAEKFRDYFLSVPGQKGLSKDWPARWRNWIRKAAEYAPQQGSAAKPKAERDLRNVPDHLLSNDEYWRKRIQRETWK